MEVVETYEFDFCDWMDDTEIKHTVVTDTQECIIVHEGIHPLGWILKMEKLNPPRLFSVVKDRQGYVSFYDERFGDDGMPSYIGVLGYDLFKS